MCILPQFTAIGTTINAKLSETPMEHSTIRKINRIGLDRVKMETTDIVKIYAFELALLNGARLRLSEFEGKKMLAW